MCTETATIFNIQRFSIHDGPGIRTTVFFKGCNLRCKWCHNPESFHCYLEREYHSKKCIGCGKCVEVCPSNALILSEKRVTIDQTVCERCFQCVEACPTNAMKKVGQQQTIEEVVDQVIRDKAYYKQSGGGVTLSGGEPLLWPDFVEGLLKKLKEHGIHTALETALNCSPEILARVIPFIDLFICDLKILDSKKHKEATGVSNEGILENFKYLSQNNVNLLVRIPIIPGINDDEANLINTMDFLKENTQFRQIELLKFHKLGESKYTCLNMDYPAKAYEEIEEKKFNSLKEMIQRNDLIAI